MVRTKISNFSLIIVHFFGTPQKKVMFRCAKPEKNAHKGLPSLMYPCFLRVLHTKTLRVFAQPHAVVTDCRLCFRRLKKDGENIETSTGRMNFFL